jgi:hypothetical protein
VGSLLCCCIGEDQLYGLALLWIGTASGPSSSSHAHFVNFRIAAGIQQPKPETSGGGTSMLWTIFAIVLLLWLLGWGFHVAGSLIHLLLVVAVVVLAIQLLTGRRAVV